MTDDTDPIDAASPFDDAHAARQQAGSDLARDAMNRARQAARVRGEARVSAQTARRRRATKATSAPSANSQPFTDGRDPAPMSDAVASLLRRMGWTEQIEVAAVTGRWREVVGDTIADHCEPLSFDEGALVVRASSTAWATQLSLMSGQLRHRLNEEFGRDMVKKLTVLGPGTRSWSKGRRSVAGRGPRDTYG